MTQAPKPRTPNKLVELRAALRRSVSRASSVFELSETSNYSEEYFTSSGSSPSSTSWALVKSIEENEVNNRSPDCVSSNSATQSLFAHKHIFGPDKSLSDRLLCLLEEWHQVYPNTQPPCSLRTKPANWSPFKVFDQDGAEFELSVHEVSFKSQKKSLTYTVMVLHPDTGPDELVAFAKTRPPCKGGILGLYLVAWLGIEKHYESEACAVRVWSRDDDEVVFKPELFDKADGDVQPSRFAKSTTYWDPGSGPPRTPINLPKDQSSEIPCPMLRFKNVTILSSRSAKESSPNEQPETKLASKRRKAENPENSASTAKRSRTTPPEVEESQPGIDHPLRPKTLQSGPVLPSQVESSHWQRERKRAEQYATQPSRQSQSARSNDLHQYYADHIRLLRQQLERLIQTVRDQRQDNEQLRAQIRQLQQRIESRTASHTAETSHRWIHRRAPRGFDPQLYYPMTYEDHLWDDLPGLREACYQVSLIEKRVQWDYDQLRTRLYELSDAQGVPYPELTLFELGSLRREQQQQIAQEAEEAETDREDDE